MITTLQALTSLYWVSDPNSPRTEIGWWEQPLPNGWTLTVEPALHGVLLVAIYDQDRVLVTEKIPFHPLANGES